MTGYTLSLRTIDFVYPRVNVPQVYLFKQKTLLVGHFLKILGVLVDLLLNLPLSVLCLLQRFHQLLLAFVDGPNLLVKFWKSVTKNKSDMSREEYTTEGYIK